METTKWEEKWTECQIYVGRYEAANMYLIESESEDMEKGTGSIFEEIIENGPKFCGKR